LSASLTVSSSVYICCGCNSQPRVTDSLVFPAGCNASPVQTGCYATGDVSFFQLVAADSCCTDGNSLCLSDHSSVTLHFGSRSRSSCLALCVSSQLLYPICHFCACKEFKISSLNAVALHDITLLLHRAFHPPFPSCPMLLPQSCRPLTLSAHLLT
jgi:hypothetical protein